MPSNVGYCESMRNTKDIMKLNASSCKVRGRKAKHVKNERAGLAYATTVLASEFSVNTSNWVMWGFRFFLGSDAPKFAIENSTLRNFDDTMDVWFGKARCAIATKGVNWAVDFIGISHAKLQRVVQRRGYFVFFEFICFFFVIFAFFGSFWLCWLFGFCWLLASALTVGFLAAFPPIDRPLVNGFLPATCRRAGI